MKKVHPLLLLFASLFFFFKCVPVQPECGLIGEDGWMGVQKTLSFGNQPL